MITTTPYEVAVYNDTEVAGGTIKELTVGGTGEALGKGSTATAIDGKAPTP